MLLFHRLVFSFHFIPIWLQQFIYCSMFEILSFSMLLPLAMITIVVGYINFG
jgi:hypothetical protein